MSYLQATSAHPGFILPVAAPGEFDFNLLATLRAWWTEYQTAAALSALSDAALADIGVERSAIGAIARSAKRTG